MFYLLIILVWLQYQDDNDWVKRCITWEVEGIRQWGRPKKTWWDCVKNDLGSIDLSQKDAQSRNKWRRIKWATAKPGSPGKMAVKMECVVQGKPKTGVFYFRNPKPQVWAKCLSLETYFQGCNEQRLLTIVEYFNIYTGDFDICAYCRYSLWLRIRVVKSIQQWWPWYNLAAATCKGYQFTSHFFTELKTNFQLVLLQNFTENDAISVMYEVSPQFSFINSLTGQVKLYRVSCLLTTSSEMSSHT